MQTLTSHRHRWPALAVLVAGQFMFVVDAFIVNIAIPSIRADLAANGAEIEAIIAIYQIAYACLLITGGRLGDLFGRKQLFLIGLAGFTLASAWCGAAQSAPMLVFARAVQGTTAGLMVPQVLASIRVLFKEEEWPRAFSIFGVALGLGAAVGLMLGGLLVTLDIAHLGWRTAFLINVPVGGVLFLLALRMIPRIETEGVARLDLMGTGLVALCIIALLAPVLFGRELGWPVWLALPVVGGLLLLWVFVGFERRLVRRRQSPLLDPAWLGDKAFATGLFGTFAAYSGITGFLLVLTLYLQNGLGYSPLLAGLTSGPLALAFLIASRWAASAAAERGPVVVMIGAGIMALALIVLAGTAYALPVPPLAMLSALLAVYGFGQGFLMAPLVNTVLSRARHIPAGAASGVLVTVQQMSGAVGIAIIGLIYFAVDGARGDSLAFAISSVVLSGTAAVTAWVVARLRIM